jgi:hypothetical protein
MSKEMRPFYLLFGAMAGAYLVMKHISKPKPAFGNFPEYPTSSSLINVNGEALKDVGVGHNYADAYQQSGVLGLDGFGFNKGMVGK